MPKSPKEYVPSHMPAVLVMFALLVLAACGGQSQQQLSAASISLNSSNVQLDSGKEFQFNAIVRSADGQTLDHEVSWQSSKTAVATIEDGLLTAVAPGTTTITARSGSVSTQALVTVDAAVIGLQLTPAELTLVLGDASESSATLGAQLALSTGETIPAVAVAWSSAEPAIATVDASGLVTAVGKGTTVITARMDTYSATADIVVEDPIIGLVIEPETISMRWGETESLTLSAYYERASGERQVVESPDWSLSPGLSASIDSSTGLLQLTGPGSPDTETGTVSVSGAEPGIAVADAPLDIENPVLSITAGAEHTMVLLADGSLYAWGRNNHGQLGVQAAPVQIQYPAPQRIDLTPFGGHRITQVSAGSYHTLALVEGGSVYAWGWNDEGQIGNGSSAPDVYEPTLVLDAADLAVEVEEVVASATASLALLADGSLYSWGDNTYGQNGHPLTEPRHLTPTLVDFPDPIDGNIAQVAPGTWHTLVLLTNGTLYGFGNNSHGQLGLGSTGPDLTARQVAPGTFSAGRVIDVSAGQLHSMALLDDGSVYAWGNNDVGQLGDGTTTHHYSPLQLAPSPFGSQLPASIYASYYQSMAIVPDGGLFAWGSNGSGQLGISPPSVSVLDPERLSYPGWTDKSVRLISGGAFHTIAVMHDESVYAWGANNYGQLGQGSTGDPRSVPQRVSLPD